MTEEFGDDEPEKAYEDTRQTVKKADNMLFSINTRLDNLRKLAGRVRKMVSDETDLRWLRHTATTIKRGINELERQSRQISKGSDKAPESIYEVKSRLEKIIRKGVKKMEKRRRLIEKKDIYDSFGLLKQFTSYDVNTIGTGSLTSRSSGLQFTIKKFR